VRISGYPIILAVVFLLSAAPAFSQRIQTERFGERDVVSQEIIVRFRGDVESKSQSVRREDSDVTVSSPIGRSGAVRLRSRGRNVGALLQAYARRADVEYAEPNFVWKASDIPNDSFFGEQWALQNTGQVVVQSGTAGADIKAVAAWDVAEGSRDFVVGMIDSGIDYSHPDLIANIWSAPSAFSVIIAGQVIQCAAGTHGFNAISRTCDPMDDDGHGTYTAGIVGASGNNAVAVSGVSRVANMMALKFLNSSGQGTTVDAIAAIEFAIQVKGTFPATANVRVLNASWGGIAFSQALLDEINFAGTNEMLFVTSAGNSSQNIDAVPEYPAAYNAANLIAVAATDNRDQLADFSNYGSGKVHLGAPGVEILSTLRGKFYGRESGTSAATAVVSGAAALLLSACNLNTADLKSNILSTVDAIPPLAGNTSTGGRLNVNNAIRNCVGDLTGTYTLAVSPSAQTIPFASGTTFPVSISALNGFASAITFSATNLPAGMSASFSPNSTLNSSTTLSIDLGPDIVQGTYLIGISATGGGVTRTIGILVTAGVPTGCTIDPAFGSTSGRLDAFDAASLHRPPSFADYCAFTLVADRAVEIEMGGGSMDSFMYLLSSTGTVIASDDNSLAGKDPKITAELFAGTYTIEATTTIPGQTGNYSLRLKSTRPNITSISPTSGTLGTSVALTVTGTAFFGQPVSLKVLNCPGVVISNIQVVSSTLITATLTLPNNTATCNIAVTNAGGDSNSQNFRIKPPPPTITGLSPDFGVQGQSVAITITGTNFESDGTLIFNNFQRGFTFVSSTTITTNLYLDPVLWSPGTFIFRFTNEGGTSNSAFFTINLIPPSLRAIYPSPVGGPGRSIELELVGQGFVGPVQILAGSKITVSNLVIVSPQDMRATFNIASDAPLGDYPVTISTSAGISGIQIFKVLPPPTISSPVPSRVFIGLDTVVKLSGTNLYCNRLPSIDGAGITVESFSDPQFPCEDQSKAPVIFHVSSSAAAGSRALTVTTPSGVSNSVTIDVVPVPAIIQSITPPYGGQGTTTTVTIAGSDLASGTVNVAGGGVVATTLNSSATSLTANLMIASNASIGPRDLTVTTAKGVSDPSAFTVTPPTWPDLTVSQNVPPVVVGGYNEVFDITVRNVGTSQTTAPITVTNTLDFGIQFVSVSSGWSCVAGRNTQLIPIVTCTTAQTIPVNSQLPLQLTIKLDTGGGGPFKITSEVQSPEDYNVSNNKANVTTQVIGTIIPTIVISPSTMQPGQQATISLVMPSKFPHDLIDSANTLTMSFSPLTLGAPADPAIQFATGGKTVSFSVKANTLTAEIQGVAGPIGFQPGTAAGQLTFTMTIRINSNQTTITRTATVSIAASVPAIKDLAVAKTSGGFETAMTLILTTREARTMTFHFNTSSPVKLNCGGVAGCSAFGSDISLSTTALFNSWFSSSSGAGGAAILRVPFNIQGTISGSIGVTIANSVGNSNTMTFDIP